jgi:hypothetical protein
MALTRKEEARALDAGERELVEKSHHPLLQELSDAELAALVRLTRERRDKASRQAHQRRREMRGKAAARGATPSSSDEGSKLKVAVLATAMRRLNSEAARRRRMAAHGALVESARKALAMKQAAAADDPGLNTRRAHEGVRSLPSKRRQNLIRPMERGRLRKAQAVAQARRDARGP